MKRGRDGEKVSARDRGRLQFILVATIFAQAVIFLLGVGNALTGFLGGNSWTVLFLVVPVASLYSNWILWQVLKHDSWSAVTRQGRRT
jgi:hypothetical protein